MLLKIQVIWDMMLCCWGLVPDIPKDRNAFIVTLKQSMKSYTP